MKHKIKKWNSKKKNYDIVELDITALRAIHLFCVHECMDGQNRLVPGCTDPNCPLYPYRLGKNPAMTQCAERNEKSRQRMRDYNQNRKKTHPSV